MLTLSPTCILPPSVSREHSPHANSLATAATNRTKRLLPATMQRGQAVGTYGHSLSVAGISCSLPKERARTAGVAVPMRLAMPLEVAREDTLPASPPAASLSPAQAFPILERVARRISGAAGYSFVGEDPDGAGIRYGLLGLRLDTGDMGAALALAHDRDPASFAASLGSGAAELLATASATTPEARKAPVNGIPLWSEPWKSSLSRVAGQDIFRAAQNEYATEALLQPVVAMLSQHALLSGETAQAMALDVLAELGREAGLAAMEAALASAPATVAAFGHALAAVCPACKLRLSELAQDERTRA